MNTLTANLKHYYQRPAMWLIYGCGPLFVLSMSCMAWAGNGKAKGGVGFVLALMIDLFFVPYVNVLPKGVLASPFAFCLPGHQDAFRRVVLTVAAVMNLILAGFLTVGLKECPFGLAVGFLSIFSIGLAVLLFVTVLDYRTRKMRYLCFAWVLFPLFMASGLRNVLESAIRNFVFSNPVLCVALGLGSIAVTWHLLGDRDLARYLIRTPMLLVFDVWNQEKVRKVAMTAEPRSRLEREPRPVDTKDHFILRQMARAQPFSLKRNVWSILYPYIHRTSVNLMFFLILMIAGTLFLGY